MAVGHMPPTARQAEWLRESWRPYGEKFATRGRQVWDYLIARPAAVQGGYFALTGLWPWLHMRSFLAVTGPKTDLWLVRTVGLLILVIGLTLAVAAWRRERTWPVVCLGVGSAAALLLVDVLFVANGTISAIYLLDAVLEAGILALWLASWRRPDEVAAAPASLPLAPPSTPEPTHPAPM